MARQRCCDAVEEGTDSPFDVLALDHIGAR